MTQKFLNLFFRGQWSNYGHFSATLIWSFTLGAIPALAIMTLWELIQWRWDSGWSWSDMAYNVAGILAYYLITYALG
jgi:hypothetical protein